MTTNPNPELLAFGAFYKCDRPEGVQIMFRREASNDATFNELYSTSVKLIQNMLDDDTLAEEEVRAQLRAFIKQYKAERIHGETPSMVSLAILIVGNIGWLHHRNKIPDDDNNGLLFATFI